MDQVREQFLTSIAAFASAWIRDQVEREVKEKPEVTLSKSKDELRAIKSELQEVLDRVPELVSKHVGRDEYWAHLSGKAVYPHSSEFGYFVHQNRLPDILAKPVREVLGYARRILVKHGYVQDPSRDPRGGGRWKEHHRFVNGTYESTVIYGFSDIQVLRETANIVEQYNELTHRFADLSSNLAFARNRKSEAEAQDLWDSI
jgi:hypothetical protein